MSQQKRGKYTRRVNQYSHSGFAGIVATSEHTTGEHKAMFIERARAKAAEAAERRQREINRRGYA